MKHIQTFENFLNEKKDDMFIAYVEDSRSFREEDLKKDYNLTVKNHDRRGFDVVGKKEDIEDFVADYAIVLPEEGIQVYESAFLNEGAKPKSWDTMFAMNAIKAHKEKQFDVEDKNSIAQWEKDYNGGNPPRPPFETEAIVRYYIETGKGPDGKP